MNESIIDYWNLVVKPNDTIYHLGDLCMGRPETITPILSRLSGNIILIRGNHDYGSRRKIYEENGIIIKDIDYLNYKGKFFILSHMPIFNPEYAVKFVGNNDEIWNLHGHTHQYSYFSEIPNAFHVGVDSNDMKPISLEQVWQKITAYENCNSKNFHL